MGQGISHSVLSVEERREREGEGFVANWLARLK